MRMTASYVQARADLVMQNQCIQSSSLCSRYKTQNRVKERHVGITSDLSNTLDHNSLDLAKNIPAKDFELLVHFENEMLALDISPR